MHNPNGRMDDVIQIPEDRTSQYMQRLRDSDWQKEEEEEEESKGSSG
jgi:hypothetical protein